MSTWEEELQVYFPGYLLPAASLEVLSREAASRFLDRLTGRNDSLRMLLAASALAPLAEEVREFAQELAKVATILPSRTEAQQIESVSEVRGRLNAPATLRRRLSGGPNQIVSNVRRRRFDRPENVLLVTTARQLTAFLGELETRKILAKGTAQGWSAGFRACSEKLKHLLSATVLRDVPPGRIEGFHEQAARAAPHRAYQLALRLHEAIKDIETRDPSRLARVVAQGALSPLGTAARFELAVLIRLGRSIEQVLSGRPYTVERALIESKRSHVFAFTSGRDCIRIYYNQLIFREMGARDRGIRHYLGAKGRFRPDITLEWRRDNKRISALVIEVKHSKDLDYLKEGYQQALLYCAEYGKELGGWPKAILVVSSDRVIKGAPRREDEVIAVDWNNWVPTEVLTSLLEGFGISAS